MKTIEIPDGVVQGIVADFIAKEFEKYVKHKKAKDGFHEYNCVKGLFGVSSKTKEIAEQEARHYFIQYYADGEYG